MFLRIVTGIIGIIIAAVVIQTGGTPFVFFAAILSLAAWHEFSAAFEKRGVFTTYIFGAIFLLLLIFVAWRGNLSEILAILMLGTLAIFLLTVLSSFNPVDVCVSTAGIFYIGLPFAHLILLRFSAEEIITPFIPLKNLFDQNLLDGFFSAEIFSAIQFDTGCALTWILFLCTWASDTFAYFVGSAFGSHKLAPSVSPKKTVEGFLGSIIGTTATGILVGHVIFSFPIILMAQVGFVMAFAATLGDLVESVIKRYAGIKDSGFLIPGHGGVLDRFDSIFFTAPIFYYIISLTN